MGGVNAMSYETVGDDAYTIATTYGCAYEIGKNEYCDRKPSAYFALSAEPPDCWADHAPNASIGTFCAEHAALERTPTLADAQAVADEIFQLAHEGYGDHGITDGWRRLLDSFPNPVPIVVAEADWRPQ